MTVRQKLVRSIAVGSAVQAAHLGRHGYQDPILAKALDAVIEMRDRMVAGEFVLGFNSTIDILVARAKEIDSQLPYHNDQLEELEQRD